MPFEDGMIDGIVFEPLPVQRDGRGWLCELFRLDELTATPQMGYVSETLPGVVRGPHEHVVQTDCFCFLGPSDFKLYLWDNRPASATYRRRQVVVVGEVNPARVLVPPGVVHAYRNIGDQPGLSYNFPDCLYRGPGRRQAVDEIRHEDAKNNPFVMEG